MRKKLPMEKVVIIGSGPAGWTAAIYTARAGLNPLVFAGRGAGKDLLPGGQLMLTTEVENYPGFPTGIEGPEMMAKFFQQAMRLGTRVATDSGAQEKDQIDANLGLYQAFQDVAKADLSARPFYIRGDGGYETLAEAVIIATGAQANWLNLENEQRLARNGGGVSACAVCDGALPAFRNQQVGVVGGGDSALEEASYLGKFASKVHIFVRRSQFRASKAMQMRVLGKEKFQIHWNAEVVDVLGEDSVTGVRLLHNLEAERSPERFSQVDLRGLFIAIGHTPITGFLKGQIALDRQGYIRLGDPARTTTSLPGVFAAGDVADPIYRQAVTASAMGAKAGIDAERFLAAASESANVEGKEIGAYALQ